MPLIVKAPPHFGSDQEHLFNPALTEDELEGAPVLPHPAVQRRGGPVARPIVGRAAAALAGVALVGVVFAALTWGDVDAQPPMLGHPLQAPEPAQEPIVELAEVPADKPRLCTDGSAFTFFVAFSFTGEGQARLLEDSAGAIELTAAAKPAAKPGPLTAAKATVQVNFTVTLLSVGSITVKYGVPKGDHVLKLSKSAESICMQVAPYAKPTDFGEEVCSFKPAVMPDATFQMKAPGQLTYGSGPGLKVGNFSQALGFVPVVLTLNGVSLKEVFSSAEKASGAEKAVGEALAYAAGHHVLPVEVQTAVISGTDKSTIIAATISHQDQALGEACAIQDTIEGAIASGYLGAAVANRAPGAGVALLQGAPLSTAAVQTEPIACHEVHCQMSNHREYNFTAISSLGFSCRPTCCEDAWAEEPVLLRPLKVPEVQNQMKAGAAPYAGFEWKGFSAPEFEDDRVPNKEDAQAIAKVLSGDGMTGKVPPNMAPVGTLFSDGVNISFEVTLQIGSGTFAQARTVLESEAGGINLTAVPSDKDGWGTLALKIGLLNGGSCKVSSPPLEEGKHWPQKYRVLVKKSDKECCIALKNMPWHAGLFSPPAKWGWPACDSAGTGHQSYIIVTSSHLGTPKDQKVIEVSQFKQTTGSLTMSFDIDHLSYSKLVQSGMCGEGPECSQELSGALQEAIAFVAGVGVKQKDVQVAFKFGVTTAEEQGHLSAADVEKMATDAKATYKGYAEIYPPAPDEEAVQEKADMLTAFKEQKPYIPPDQRAQTEEDKAVRVKDMMHLVRKALMKDLSPQKQDSTTKDPMVAWLEQRRRHGGKNNRRNRRLATRSPTGILGVTASLNVPDPQTAVNNLNSPAAAGQIVNFLRDLTGNGPNGAGTTGQMNVAQMAVPAKITWCNNIACPAFKANIPFKVCTGADCQNECCTQMPCFLASCEGGLSLSWAKALETCTSEQDCQKCCAQSCANFDCNAHAACKKPYSWFLTAAPDKAVETCCNRPKCCTAPTAYCMSCVKCQTMGAFCKSELYMFVKKSANMDPSKLSNRRLQETDEESVEMIHEWPLKEHHWHASHHQPVFDHEPYDPDEVAADDRELDASIARTIPALREQLERETGRRLKGDALPDPNDPTDQMTTLLNAKSALASAASFRLDNIGAYRVALDPILQLKSVWAGKWNEVVMQSMAAAENRTLTVTGCEIMPPIWTCGWTLKSIFLLHRGFGINPKRVNVVRVLLDTRHAVSCGDDGVCWVWTLSTGHPRQAFIPNAPDFHTPRGIVTTATLSNDGSFILSGGSNSNNRDNDTELNSGGTMYVWDWNLGVQKGSLSLNNGHFLSSTTMQQWHMVIVGNYDFFTYFWNIEGDNTLRIPYYANKPEEIASAIAARIQTYYETNIDGVARLAATKAFQTINGFLDLVKGLGAPNMLNWYTILNKEGPINGLSYIPSDLKYASASGDGIVRLRSADSGDLQMAMGGHLGPVLTICSTPTYIRAVSGGADGTARLWELKTGRQLLIMAAPQHGPVNSVWVFPTGDRVVTGDEAGFWNVWSLSSGLRECTANVGSPVTSVTVNPSNPETQVVVASEDGYVRVFNPR